MNRTAAVKIVCIVAVLIFAYFELQTFVFPKAEALNARSFDSPVKIDKSIFPDTAFREYVSKKVDVDNDGYLTPQERDAVIEISNSDLSGKGVSDISGIGYFPLLERIDLSNNSIVEANVSQNKKLVELDLRGNKIPEGAEFNLRQADSVDSEITIYVSNDSTIDFKSSNVNVVKAD